MFGLLIAAALLVAASPPGEVETRLQAGQSALATREYATAKKQFTAVLAADPGNSAAHLALAAQA